MPAGGLGQGACCFGTCTEDDHGWRRVWRIGGWEVKWVGQVAGLLKRGANGRVSRGAGRVPTATGPA